MPNNDFSACVKQDQFSSFFTNGVDKFVKMGYNDIDGEVVDSSDVTKCDRRIHYGLTGCDPMVNKIEQINKRFLNHKWAEILSSIKGLEIIDRDLAVADHNYSIVSEVDFICRLNDDIVLVSVVEVQNEVFQSGKAVRRNVVDVMSQMWMAEVDDGFLIYENALDKSSSVFHILPNVSVLKAVKDKLLNLRKQQLLGILPERRYEAIDSKECQECRFSTRCWSKKGNG